MVVPGAVDVACLHRGSKQRNDGDDDGEYWSCFRRCLLRQVAYVCCKQDQAFWGEARLLPVNSDDVLGPPHHGRIRGSRR